MRAENTVHYDLQVSSAAYQLKYDARISLSPLNHSGFDSIVRYELRYMQKQRPYAVSLSSKPQPFD